MFNNYDADIKPLYPKMCLASAFLHALYCILFYYCEILVLAIYNIFSVFLYLFCFLKILKGTENTIKKYFMIIFIEIIAFCCLGTLILGYRTGFNSYIMSLIPLTVCYLYSDKNIDRKKALFFILFELLIFFISLHFSFFLEHPYIPEYINKLIYVLNLVAGVFINVSFLITFIFTIRESDMILMEENKRLDNAANYDPLTKILNRRTFDDNFNIYLNKAKDNNEIFSVIIFDIDDFKRVNDTYGHDAGDIVLQRVTKTLKRTIRNTDMIFRWGGEEIMIILGPNVDAAKIVAERCRESIENLHLKYEDFDINVTVSAGMCTYNDLETKESMIDKADDALYVSKHNGKNQINFSEKEIG